MKGIFLSFILVIIFFINSFSFTWELGLRTYSSPGVFQAVQVKLYHADNPFTPYKIGYTGNFDIENLVNGRCDIGTLVNTNPPILWDPLPEPPAVGTNYRLRIGNRYIILHIPDNSLGADFILRFIDNNFYIDDNPRGVTISETMDWDLPILFEQVDQSESPIGSVAVWEGTEIGFTNRHTAPYTFNLNLGDHLFDADRNVINSKKFSEYYLDGIYKYLNYQSYTVIDDQELQMKSYLSTVSGSAKIQNLAEGILPIGGNVTFYDPWVYDLEIPPYGFMNRGLYPYPRIETSPFEPNITSTYKGVLLNQNVNFLSSEVNYSLGAITPQTIGMGGTYGNRTLWFKGWSGNPSLISFKNSSAQTTGVVFKGENSITNAIFKGHLLSSVTSPLGTNSQRKLVRSSDGIYHLFYISMGTIWYTKSTSTDFAGNWTPEVDLGYMLDNPTISLSVDITDNFGAVTAVGDQIAVAYTDGNFIAFNIVDAGLPGIVLEDPVLLNHTLGEIPIHGYSGVNPVVAISQYQMTIVFKTGSSSGLSYARCYYYGNSWTFDEDEDNIVPNTNFTTCNPSIAAVKNGSYHDYIHLTYQSGNLGSSIMHTFSSLTTPLQFVTPFAVSSGAGYNTNMNPSMSLFYNGNMHLPIVSWTAKNNNTLLKDAGTPPVEPRMVCRAATGLETWSRTYYVAGADVDYSNNNSVNSSGGNHTVVTWSESDGTDEHWARRDGDNFTITCSYLGSGLVSNITTGSSVTQMKGFLGVSSVMPSILQPVNENFNASTCAQAKVTSVYDMLYARSGVVLINGVEFLFSTGDIICNDNAVKFITVPDTLMYSNDTEINRSLRSEDFILDQNASLLFTNYYYVLNESGADTLLNENDVVNFKVELVNSVTNTVVGTFDNITFTKENLENFENISYEVDCSDIVPGTYYLRLVLDVTGNAEYVMINAWNDPSSALKRNYNSVSYAGTEIPKEYAVSQNYPNPFNPTTVIEYQLPKAGIVTLMIYDILGREVKTLINEEKSAGKYSVNFNGSDLASGTYIYRLKVNDFVSTKKMILVK